MYKSSTEARVGPEDTRVFFMNTNGIRKGENAPAFVMIIVREVVWNTTTGANFGYLLVYRVPQSELSFIKRLYCDFKVERY